MNKINYFSFTLLITLVGALSFNQLNAQSKNTSGKVKKKQAKTSTAAAPADKKAKAAMLSNCSPSAEGKLVSEMTVAEAVKWVQTTPPTVICDDNKEYKLNTFQFTMIFKDPFMTKEYGTGIGGVPILGVKAVESAKPGDTILLKEVSYLDAEKKEQKLPNIVFSLK